MMNIYEEPYAPVSEAQIVEAEFELGYKLPDDFVRFLRTMNGGNIREECQKYVQIVPLHSGELDESYLTDLYGFHVAEYLDTLAMKKRYSMDPDWLIQIGSVHGTDRFVLDLRPEPDQFGKVYVRCDIDNPDPVFEPEEFVADEDDLDEDETAEEAYRQFVTQYWYVAESFTAFLARFGIVVE
jgi:hypothetical protein